MIIDTSAIIAIIGREPGYERLEERIAEAVVPKIGAPTQLETGMVLVGRWGARGNTLLARFLQHNGIKTVPFTEAHTEIAVDAFNRFGRGRHPAALNFGDCLSYATAYVAGEPLLFVGNDFSQTDLPLVK
ncbi:type II toxin-antitoxin system VapC family toxin [Solihabitans fulvus]|uniref:Ribonuclease VapC n=1 Tax=Solihabitans fulvus TaxID=1892852 RepID=A0A5B2XFG8_9PSEU|nr:type II toxin-antitoxin system VapC family toxin [Solihabitans fulvus]KAA2261631.1 type II toxin-antitoxin system VapC family toxin [Solihabitans fulvus]